MHLNYFFILIPSQGTKFANLIKILSQLISGSVSGIRSLGCNNSHWSQDAFTVVANCHTLFQPPRRVFVVLVSFLEFVQTLSIGETNINSNTSSPILGLDISDQPQLQGFVLLPMT